VPIAWPNAALPPSNGRPWLRVGITYGAGSPRTMGGEQGKGGNQIAAVLGVAIYVPLGFGQNDLMELADVVRGIVNRRDLGSGVRFGVPSLPQPLGEFANYHEALVTAPFTVDEDLT
jgi:hypothetical protein